MQFTIQDFTSPLKNVDKGNLLQPLVNTACRTILGGGKRNIQVSNAIMIKSPLATTTYLTIPGLAYFCMRLIRRTLLDLYSAKIQGINMTTIAKDLTRSIFSMVSAKTTSTYFADYQNLLQGITARGFRWVANERRTTWFPSREGSPLLPPAMIYQCPSFNPAKKWARTHMEGAQADDIPGPGQHEGEPREDEPLLPGPEPVAGPDGDPAVAPDGPAAPNPRRGPCEAGYADLHTYQCPAWSNVCADPTHGCVPFFYAGNNQDQGQFPFAIHQPDRRFRGPHDTRLKCECRPPPYGPAEPESDPGLIGSSLSALRRRFATGMGARAQVGVDGLRRALRVKDVWVPGIAQTHNQPGYYGYFQGVDGCGMYGCTPMRMGTTDICPKTSPVVNFCGKPENESLYYGNQGRGIALWPNKGKKTCARKENSLSLGDNWCGIRSHDECTDIKNQNLCSMAYTIADDKQIQAWNNTPVLKSHRHLVKGDALKCKWADGKCNAPIPPSGAAWREWKEKASAVDSVCPACPTGTCRLNIYSNFRREHNIHPLRCAVNGECPTGYTKIGVL